MPTCRKTWRSNSTTIEAFNIIYSQLTTIENRSSKKSTEKKFVSRNRIKKRFFVVGTLSIITSGICTYHCYLAIDRYLKHPYMLEKVDIYQENLPLPITKLHIYSRRNETDSFESKNVTFSIMTRHENDLNHFSESKLVPDWSYTEFEDIFDHYIELNRVDLDHPSSQNVDDIQAIWPYKISYTETLRIMANFDAKNFVERKDENGNEDHIVLSLAAFDTNSEKKEIMFELMPCEQLDVSVALEYYSMINKPNNPCRDEYPNEIAERLNATLPAHLMFNPVFATNFPYDADLCEVEKIIKNFLKIL